MRIISSKVLNNNMCRIDYSLIVYIIETIAIRLGTSNHFSHSNYTVSMKFLSVRENTTTEKARVRSMKRALYNSPPQSRLPQPRVAYLKVSKIGVKGLSAMMSRYFSGAADSG